MDISKEYGITMSMHRSKTPFEVADDGQGVRTSRLQQFLEADANISPGGYRDIYAMSEAAGAPVTEAEVGGTMAGFVPGKVAGLVGAPGDITALAAGLYKAAFPDKDQGRLDAFITQVEEVSNKFGSGATLGFLDDWATQSGISDEVKQGFMQGAEVGSFFGLGQGAKATGKGVAAAGKAVAEGAPARIAERGEGVTLGMGADPMAPIDDAIVGAQKLMGKKPAVTLLPASDAPTVSGLAPQYRVTVDGFTPEGTGKQSLIPIKLTPANAEKVKPVMEQLAQDFPDPLASPETYAAMTAKMQNKAEVSMPPNWMIEHANNPEKWANWFDEITPDQIKAANEGLSVQKKFIDAYAAGTGPELTGQLMLWTILSRMLSAFPHEGGYLELAEAATPFIQKAARGEWSDADTAAWREMSMTIQPEGAPGKSATSNANDFGEVFLKKMSAVDENGVSALTRLHNMIADPNISSAQIRREYYSLAEGTGIANKILSFALLVSGRNDVVVLDRIQINQMWGGGEKIYDDIMKQFEGAQGLAQYEALERSLLNRVPDLYQRVGRGDVGSVGRYHWESWVRSSGQIVAHPTLEAVVGMGTKRPGSNISPTEFTPVTEGRFHTKFSGVSYEKLPGGKSRFVYNTSTGEPYEFTKQQLDGMFKEAFNKKSGVLPTDFPGVKAFEGGNIPWYEFKGVDRGKLDELIKEKGKPATD
tara:strand:+ start:1639 stop:3747 length:2109 start_codon:yes stop_codon:yes gene_type:complete